MANLWIYDEENDKWIKAQGQVVDEGLTTERLVLETVTVGNVPVVLEDANGLVPGMEGYVGPVVQINDDTPVDMNLKTVEDLTFTIDNTETHTFLNAVTADGNGTAYTIGGQKTLLISITGADVTTSTLTFQGGDTDGNYVAVMGIRMSDFATATSSSTVASATPELWQFDITGLTTFRTVLSSLTGEGAAITVKGKSVG